ncbi:YcjF family protein [Helicobacter pylori]|uniref:YcjF family protein n=1 Tax=Helicobacter pylori TaxID=210 RepID=UPI0019225E75|nr:DUF697 domain-containing protein [Helicobacter pylori]QQX49463.1 DUF697 domain-containing protein [Helicobacter pylori]
MRESIPLHFHLEAWKSPLKGLKELVDETKKCLSDAMRNHFLRVQKIKIQERKQAMIDESKTIINIASGMAGSAGLIPIPFSDAPAIAPIQTGMIYKINDAFGVKMKDSVATSLITGLLGVTGVVQAGRTLVNGFLKFIPVAGSIVGGVVAGTTAAAITGGIGFAYLKVLEKCFNDETGEVELPAMDTIKSLFKESYLSLDTIKKLKP